jgi:hypothetical protein
LSGDLLTYTGTKNCAILYCYWNVIPIADKLGIINKVNTISDVPHKTLLKNFAFLC